MTAMSVETPSILTSKSLGTRKVIAPKTKPPAAVTIASETNARFQPGAKPTSAFFLNAASGDSAFPFSIKLRYPKPIRVERTPGMMKASRQSYSAKINPVTNGAPATPILPQTPFKPRRQPTFPSPSMTMAIPTG